MPPNASAISPKPSPRIWALVPCAGTGSRAGTQMPKQYQQVAGNPMVRHTLAAFGAVPRIAGTLVVVSAGDRFFDALSRNDQPKDQKPAGVMVSPCGGPTRATSVLNGLLALQQQGAQTQDWVLVHDAARCLIAPVQINSLIDACLDDPVGGLLALKLPDTLKREYQGRVAETIERADKWLAQTPQMFRLGTLVQALQAAGDRVTDEASAMELLGLAPLLVEGSAQNFKVTYPQDFALAEAVLHSRRVI
ncbi:MAG: 2-C-methyl-D-erythritol 4-phosphate cytidylyltransferase [Rhodoferax sp.]|nr:2-C-methyl-D-erythritol 4-phosphate cytidylyltransferase [Rhodoferax sp.]